MRDLEDGAYVSPHTNLKANILDITDFKEKGTDLTKAIEQAVKDSQSIVLRPLPDKLVITKEQYADLSRSKSILEYYDMTGELLQDSFLYRTPLNVMEIEVKE